MISKIPQVLPFLDKLGLKIFSQSEESIMPTGAAMQNQRSCGEIRVSSTPVSEQFACVLHHRTEPKSRQWSTRA